GLNSPLNPESSWSSKLADEKHNNNLPGLKHSRVDELCRKYDVTFDREGQIKLIREIDSIIFRVHPYALAWYANFNRVLYWNKFGHPKTYFSKIGDYRGIKSMWWRDSDKEKSLDKAMKDGSKLPAGKTIQKPWE
ncbi:unnamed protein product, partial [marine sediment metagenome]